MATKRQIDANRRNAQKSTGPKTIQGKENARENALKHGLTSRRTILPAENAAEFHQLRAELIQSWKPANKGELLLVDHIAFSHWRMLRGRAAEFGIFNLEIEGSKKRAGIAPEDHSRDWEALGVGLVVEEKGSFDNFFRYEAAAERLFFRSTEQLRKLQAARFKTEEDQSERSPRLLSQPRSLASTAGSPSFGEVFAAAAAASAASTPRLQPEHLDISSSTLVSENGIGFVAQHASLPPNSAPQMLGTASGRACTNSHPHLIAAEPLASRPAVNQTDFTRRHPPSAETRTAGDHHFAATPFRHSADFAVLVPKLKPSRHTPTRRNTQARDTQRSETAAMQRPLS